MTLENWTAAGLLAFALSILNSEVRTKVWVAEYLGNPDSSDWIAYAMILAAAGLVGRRHNATVYWILTSPGSAYALFVGLSIIGRPERQWTPLGIMLMVLGVIAGATLERINHG